ncbi:MAG: universal stress protein [Massilibacteroides sp.]|nr:universal stress protein [Massilibacteroides sp.]MDD3061496.1 universal stress protein [Massilibacteroides sp.]MDD4116443.1 universal stress protein [Massilibacteroides sp.]MDD4659214.1 universal stress protein [Massilibacteroides sp.]
MSYKKILIAVDGQENSINVARKGFELAEQSGAEPALIFVIDKSKAITNPDAGIMPNEALMVLKKEAQETMEQLIRLNNRSKETTKFMPECSPKEGILKIAKIWEADLIIMGIRGKNGFNLWAMGSVAQYIILHSALPVMVIPAQ